MDEIKLLKLSCWNYDKDLKLCKGCNKAKYYNITFQKNQWKYHKNVCGKDLPVMWGPEPQRFSTIHLENGMEITNYR